MTKNIFPAVPIEAIKHANVIYNRFFARFKDMPKPGNMSQADHDEGQKRLEDAMHHFNQFVLKAQPDSQPTHHDIGCMFALVNAFEASMSLTDKEVYERLVGMSMNDQQLLTFKEYVAALLNIAKGPAVAEKMQGLSRDALRKVVNQSNKVVIPTGSHQLERLEMSDLAYIVQAGEWFVNNLDELLSVTPHDDEKREDFINGRAKSKAQLKKVRKLNKRAKRLEFVIPSIFEITALHELTVDIQAMVEWMTYEVAIKHSKDLISGQKLERIVSASAELQARLSASLITKAERQNSYKSYKDKDSDGKNMMIAFENLEQLLDKLNKQDIEYVAKSAAWFTEYYPRMVDKINSDADLLRDILDCASKIMNVHQRCKSQRNETSVTGKEMKACIILATFFESLDDEMFDYYNFEEHTKCKYKNIKFQLVRLKLSKHARQHVERMLDAEGVQA